jgi:hypothetical protein
MVASPGNPDTKPYGLNRLWITPYADTDGSILGPTSYRLPLGRTLAFTENEDSDTLDGDDKASVAVQGKGATVSGSLEAGGLDLTTFAIITGGQLIESGGGANLKRTVRKRGSDQRGYWRAEGQSISNGGGDNVTRIFRCKANGKIQADMKYGTFMVPSIDFLGTPMPGDDDDYLWEIDYHATKVTLGETPIANPLPIPSNVTVGALTATTAVVLWNDIAVADSFKLQKSATLGGTYVDIASGSGGAPTNPTATLTALTAATTIYVRVAGVFGGVTGDYSSPVAITTPAS